MAYDNLVLKTSVVDAMMAAGMYQSGGKTTQENLLTVAPDGTTTTHIMAEIDYYDLMIFADEMDIILKLQNPLIQNLVAKNAPSIAQLIRGVNYNTRSGYKGSSGSGNALDAIFFHEGQFQNPDAAGIAPRTTWVRNVAAAANLQFICQPDALGANTHAALQLGNNEGFALLGFANEAAAPITTTEQHQYLGVNYNIQNLSYSLANAIYGNSIIELKQPLLVWPNETVLVNVRYFTNGQDELQPIGLWIKTAANLRNMASS
ncbi:MAG: hypothetical protein PHI12_06960 [Dehalococcoidales bacterium]|nr:hypothetical protein [Dehalococcoidales bacterium]